MKNWIEINLPWEDVEYTEDDYIYNDSFIKRKLNLPGTVIETSSGKKYIIGNINTVGGICDCCTFDTNEIIIKYKPASKDFLN